MVVLLVLQAIIALALIGVILVQKSEGGGPLGMGGQSGGGGGNMFTSRGAANFLTRTTAVLAALFMGNCLLMTIVAGKQIHKTQSILSTQADAPLAADVSTDQAAPLPNSTPETAALEDTTLPLEDAPQSQGAA